MSLTASAEPFRTLTAWSRMATTLIQLSRAFDLWTNLAEHLRHHLPQGSTIIRTMGVQLFHRDAILYGDGS